MRPIAMLAKAMNKGILCDRCDEGVYSCDKCKKPLKHYDTIYCVGEENHYHKECYE